MRLRPVIKKYQEAGNSEKSHKEGPTPVGGCLMRLRPVIKKYQDVGNSEKSHKEGPAPVGGCLMRLRPVIKSVKKPYELASGNKKYQIVAMSGLWKFWLREPKKRVILVAVILQIHNADRRDCNDRGNKLWRCGDIQRKDTCFIQKLQKQV